MTLSIVEVVATNIRVLSAARGTSPSGIALELGMSRQWIQNKMAGRARWNVDDLERIGGVLGVTMFELISDEWWPDQFTLNRESR